MSVFIQYIKLFSWINLLNVLDSTSTQTKKRQNIMDEKKTIRGRVVGVVENDLVLMTALKRKCFSHKPIKVICRPREKRCTMLSSWELFRFFLGLNPSRILLWENNNKSSSRMETFPLSRARACYASIHVPGRGSAQGRLNAGPVLLVTSLPPATAAEWASSTFDALSLLSATTACFE